MDTEGVSDEREGARDRERENFNCCAAASPLTRSFFGADPLQEHFDGPAIKALSLGGFPANDLNFGTCFPDF
jgi:hypothetical protein